MFPSSIAYCELSDEDSSDLTSKLSSISLKVSLNGIISVKGWSFLGEGAVFSNSMALVSSLWPFSIYSWKFWILLFS